MGGLESIVDKCYNFCADNPVITGGVIGLATFVGSEGVYIARDMLQSGNEVFHLYALAFGGSAGYFSYLVNKGNQTLNQLGVNFRDVRKKLNLRDFVKKKKRNIAEKIIDTLVEHPLIAGMAASGKITVGTYLTRTTNPDIDEQSLIVQSLVFFVGGSYVIKKAAEFAGPFVHSSSLSSNVRNLKFNFLKTFGNKEKLLASREKFLRNDSYNSLAYNFVDLAVELKQNNLAFEIIKDAHEKIGFEDFFHSSKGVALGAFKDKVRTHYKKLQESDSFSNYLALSLSLLKIGERDKALELINTFTKKSESNPEISLNAKLSEALFLKNIGENELFVDKLNLILPTITDKLKQIGDYKIFTIADNDFSNHTFAIRKGELGALAAEKMNNHEIKTNFDLVNDEKQFRIMETPEIIKLDDNYFGVTVYESGQTMFDHIQSVYKTNFDLKGLKDIARFMGRIHGSNPLHEPKPVDYYFEEIMKRIDAYMGNKKDAIERIKDNIQVLLYDFNFFPRVVNIDGHLFNFNKGSHYTKLDNEFREPTLPCYELSKLLEQGKIIPNNGGGDAWKTEIIEEYQKELSNFHKEFSFEDLLVHKLKSDPIKALSYYLFSNGYPLKKEIATQFVQNAIHSLYQSKPYFNVNEQKAITQVEKGLTELIT